MGSETDPVFREVQRFRQVWLWVPLGTVSILVVGDLAYDLVRQISLREPLSDIPDLTSRLPAVLIIVGVLWLMYVARLETEVRSEGLFVRFFPFHLSYKRIALEDVERIEARTYRPLLQYGGWGIRYTWRGKAYNVSGNRGVRIDYASGRHLLIGSQRAEELATAITLVSKPSN